MTAVTAPTKAPTVKDQRDELKGELDRYAEKIATYGVNANAYITSALVAAVKTPDLYNCTPASVALALTLCAQTGLEIGRTAHLVPFGKVCTFMADYKGLIELAMATHKVVSVRVRCVYEKELESFRYKETGSGPDIEHEPMLSGDRGALVGAYAIADMRFGRFKVEFMRADEIDKIRQDKSMSWKKGPLTDWYARKTVVRKLCKTLPSSQKLQAALRYDDTEEIEIPDGEFSVEDQTRIASQKPKALRGVSDEEYGGAPDSREPGADDE